MIEGVGLWNDDNEDNDFWLIGLLVPQSTSVQKFTASLQTVHSLIQQAKLPKRNRVEVSCFNIIFHQKGMINPL